jgi:hypothetical protein
MRRGRLREARGRAGGGEDVRTTLCLLTNRKRREKEKSHRRSAPLRTASEESDEQIPCPFSSHSCDRCVSRYKCGSTHTISCTATGFNRPVIKCSSQSSLPPWWPFCVPLSEQTTIMTFTSKSTLELGSVSREKSRA